MRGAHLILNMMPVLQGLRPLLHGESATHAGHESAVECARAFAMEPKTEHHRQSTGPHLSVQDPAALHLAAAAAC